MLLEGRVSNKQEKLITAFCDICLPVDTGTKLKWQKLSGLRSSNNNVLINEEHNNETYCLTSYRLLSLETTYNFCITYHFLKLSALYIPLVPSFLFSSSRGRRVLGKKYVSVGSVGDYLFRLLFLIKKEVILMKNVAVIDDVLFSGGALLLRQERYA